jgi:predicted nucleic acid-binding protein
MAAAIFPNERLFLDSSFMIAALIATDQRHERARSLFEEMDEAEATVVTTQPVLLEIANFLSRLRYRTAAQQYFSSLRNDPKLGLVTLSEPLWQSGLDLYTSRHDKEWSLTDCISFVVMNDLQIQRALTSDHHFEQAGFVALMR